MKRIHWISLGGLALLFFTATVARLAPTNSDALDDTTKEEAARKERARRFWELHREAGKLRIAGDHKSAIRLYEEALKLDERHEDALYYVANMYLEEGRLADAERSLSRLVQFHPTSSRGYSRLGDTHLCYADAATFDAELARAAFEMALEVNKQETGPQLRMAQVALIEEQLDEAERFLDTVLSSNAASIEANYLKGFLDWKQGDKAAARKMYDRAMQFARDEGPKDKVVGEGDRKKGSAIKPGEQVTCPLMLELLHDVVAAQDTAAAPPSMPASYVAVARKLLDMRKNHLL